MDKFLNQAIIGNKNIVASLSESGELMRFCFPYIDGRQFVDFFHTGLKINDSNIVYLHSDINNSYSQKYVDGTNILITNINNTYFKLNIEQTDCAFISENILLRKYVFKNENSIDLDLKFIVNNKILANNFENYGSKIFDNGIIQYNHNYTFSIFSKEPLYGHRLNNVADCINGAVLEDKDYIGMSNETAISYNLGTLKPGKEITFSLYVYVDESSCDIQSKLYNKMKMCDENKIDEVKKYWRNYLSEHKSIKLTNGDDEFNKKIIEIYNRTILLYPLLINYDSGGISAALEVDEERQRSGGYRYCWTRDAIFITEAFNLLKMEEDTERFYSKFCKNTQSENGMWEQRFFSDGKLAPCWGYQIDETASVVYGVYKHYEHNKDKSFLKDNLKMCENAIKFLTEYVENVLEIEEEDSVKKELKERYKKNFEISKHASYDLWEMNEGVHLYSLASIIASFDAMKNIYLALEDDNDRSSRLKKEKIHKLVCKIDKYALMILGFIRSNLVDNNQKILKRNLSDDKMDISVIGVVCPFDILDIREKIVKNTVDKINMTLRTYRGGYLRFEGDGYMNGDKPWIIATLWMALYYIKLGDKEQAEECFKYVVETSSKYGFLSEQVSNEDSNFQWVVGLGWSHAMFVIVLNELLKFRNEKEGENGKN